MTDPVRNLVHDRSRTEAALRASEERLRYFVEHAQDIIYYCNADGYFTYVNPTAARVMKYSEDELIGRHFLTLIRRDYRDKALDLYSRQMVDATPNTYFEFPAVTKTGETMWVGQHVQLVFNGADVVGVQAIARDITQQKQADEQLRQSEARYRSLIQGAAYGICRTTIDGTILDANPALATMLGYESVDALIDGNSGDLYRTPADRTKLVDRLSRGGERTLSVDVEWRRKDGVPIFVRLTARIVDVGDGRPTFEAIVEDITSRRTLEEQLRQAQRMEAVARLARTVAHDFNNVLAAILGCADLLAMRIKKKQAGREEVEEIQNAAERGAVLTRQLLNFSRRQVLEPQLLDVHAVVRGVESMLARLAEPVDLHVHTPGTPPIVRLEPGQIERVLMNLIVNARDATPAVGTIDVTAATVDVADRDDLPSGRYARLEVRDTGSGIDPDIQARVFEPFFTTKDPDKGTGLGLPIVQGIVKDAKGAVAFTSTPKAGTTFEVLLPLAPPPQPA